MSPYESSKRQFRFGISPSNYIWKYFIKLYNEIWSFKSYRPAECSGPVPPEQGFSWPKKKRIGSRPSLFWSGNTMTVILAFLVCDFIRYFLIALRTYWPDVARLDRWLTVPTAHFPHTKKRTWSQAYWKQQSSNCSTAFDLRLFARPTRNSVRKMAIWRVSLSMAGSHRKHAFLKLARANVS